MFEPSTVALHGVYQNQYQGGGYVAILGGGTIGMFTMQWTKIFGSRKVVDFDISDERLELAKRLGADEVINTTQEDYLEKAMAITENKGYDYVFETAGQVPTLKWPLTWRQIRRMCAASERLTQRSPSRLHCGRR